MKDKILLLLFILTYSSLSQKMPEDYLDEADNQFEQGEYNIAVDNYLYVINNYPDYPEFYSFALYNLAVTYERINKTDKAIKLYKQILKQNFESDIMIQAGIMDNPYANFSFQSCLNLGRMYYNNKNYDESLNYYIFADTSNLYKAYCGNAYAEMNYYVKKNIAKCYIGLGEEETAIRLLTKEVFTGDLASNNDLMTLLMKTINGLYDIEEIKKILKKSIKKIYQRNDKYYMILFGEEIQIYNMKKMLFKTEFTKEEIITIVKENKFFKNYLN
jgi:tetratricopeptide (TPR) repeat protein